MDRTKTRTDPKGVRSLVYEALHSYFYEVFIILISNNAAICLEMKSLVCTCILCKTGAEYSNK